jgi:biotin carboxylase
VAGHDRRAVAVVSDGVLGAVAPLAGQVRTAGARPVLITGEPSDARLAAWRELYDEVVVLDDPGDSNALVETVLRAAAGSPLAGLFSCFDGLCLPAARAAAALDLPHPPIDGLAAARDKGATRLALARHGIPSLRSQRLSGAGDLRPAGEHVGFPAVLKPVDGTASHFVSRVEDQGGLEAAYGRACERLTASWPALHRPNGSGPPAFLLEEFVAGAEYSLDVVVRGGRIHRIAAFDKFIVDEDGFVECAFATPFLRGDERLAAELWEYVESCLQAVGVDDTLAHVEVIVGDAGPRLIEINAGRPGGQILVRAMLDLVGVDLLAELVALQIGAERPRPRPPSLAGQVATYTLFPPHSGRVTELHGLDALRRLEHVVDVIPYCSVGDWVDLEDKEFFALNVLTAGLEPDRLVPFYDELRRTASVVVEAS